MTTQIPQGYKQTSVGIIPEDWEVKRLREVTLNKGQYGINASAVPFNHDLPKYLRITDIDDDGYFSKDKLSSVNQINSDEFFLKEDDIVFVRTGATTGKSYLYNKRDGQLVYAGFLIKFSIDTAVADKYFIWSFTKSSIYNDWVKMYSQRSGQPGLNSNEYGNLIIPFPPLPEQQKIAEIFSTWDTAIGTCQKTIEQLKQRNKGIAQQLLSGNNRLGNFNGHWHFFKLKDIAKRVTAKNEELNDTVVTISAQRGFVLQEDYFSKRVASATLSHYTLLRKGQFAYNKSYSKGYPMGAFKRLDDFEKAVVTTLYICFEINENVDSDFINFYFEHGFMINGIMQIAQEGARAHGLLNIALEDFFNLDVKIPVLEEQKAIVDILNNASNELRLYQEKLNNLQQQKKGLMQQLLTGKVRTI